MNIVPQTRPLAPRESFLRMAQVEQITGLKKTTIYRLMLAKQFVQCVKVTPRCTAWPASAVYAWVQERIAASAGSGQ